MTERGAAMLLLASLVVAGPGNAAVANTSLPPGPIEHVVVLVMQNGTFDNVFGTYPGADGLGIRTPHLRDSAGRLRSLRRLSPEDLGPNGIFAAPAGVEPISNGHTEALVARNGGKMDLFLRAQAWRGLNEDLVLRYYDRTTLPALWGLADEFVIFDRYFSSFPADSLPNVLHLIAGSNYGIDRGSKETLSALWKSRFPTIFDRATAADVGWKYYVGGLRQLDRAKLVSGGYFDGESRPSQLYWAPVLSIARFSHDRELASKIQDQEQFFEDAATDNLPAISYVLPVPNTHWPTSPQQSQARLLSFVNAVKKSPAWPRTVMFMVTDDWGGFYDHVPPPRFKEHLLGFRVPMLLVSPLAKKGFVSHALLDHGAIPAFIAETFGLTPVAKPHTPARFEDVWNDEIRGDNKLLSLGQTLEAQAFGKDHAPGVFALYVWGLVVAMILLVVPTRRVRRRPVVVSVRSPAPSLALSASSSVAGPRSISVMALTSHGKDGLRPSLDPHRWITFGASARSLGKLPDSPPEAFEQYGSSGRSIAEVAKTYGVSIESLRRLSIPAQIDEGGREGLTTPDRELAVVHDAVGRRPVDWAMTSKLESDLVLEALERATHNEEPDPRLVHQTDRLAQHASLALGLKLAEEDILASVRSIGENDDPVIKSFFAALEAELLDQSSSPTRGDAGMYEFIRGLLMLASSALSRRQPESHGDQGKGAWAEGSTNPGNRPHPAGRRQGH